MDKHPKINLLSFKKISPAGQHCAFPDLMRLKNKLLLCFRVAPDHHFPLSSICVLAIDDEGKEINRHFLSLPKADLRDPRLVLIQKRLFITAYSREQIVLANGKTERRSRNTFWELDAQGNWAHRGYFAGDFHWCWRFRWYKEQLFSIAYERSKEHLLFYSGQSLASLSAKAQPILSHSAHGFGYPNETDMHFYKDTAIAIVRRDADTFSSLIGKSKAPFEDWLWEELNVYLASPCIVAQYGDHLLVAARYEHSSKTVLNEHQQSVLKYFMGENISYIDGELKTGIFLLNIHTHKLQLVLSLPSFGDNGYPATAINGKHLWLSYYTESVVEDSQKTDSSATQVYLCCLSLPEKTHTF